MLNCMQFVDKSIQEAWKGKFKHIVAPVELNCKINEGNFFVEVSQKQANH